MKAKYLHYIEKFPNSKIFVIGDVMVDKFVYGTVSRISPEAPVPVVEITKETYLPGGAGNVGNNIVSLGAKVFLSGIVGDDDEGYRLIDHLKSLKINTDGIFVEQDRPTTIKTRVIAHHQQVVRFDKEKRISPKQKTFSQLIDYIEETLPKVDAVIISDYGKGVIQPAILKKAILLARKLNKPITVDPKVEHFLKYRKVTSLTPNLQEATLGMKITHKIESKEEIENLGLKILKKLDCDSVIITLGERGMAVFEKHKKPIHIPTRAKEVFDVTGAGDTVISVLTLGFSVGAPFIISAEIANYAAGVVVGKLGTATVSMDELKSAING
ncbi:MAG: D-glycero-beta-D-manno-heptose-7-phosphate kinase [Endomicrobiia bacterium]